MCLGASVAKKSLRALAPLWQKNKKIFVPWCLSGKSYFTSCMSFLTRGEMAMSNTPAINA
jgi:hypothetical protein